MLHNKEDLKRLLRSESSNFSFQVWQTFITLPIRYHQSCHLRISTSQDRKSCEMRTTCEERAFFPTYNIDSIIQSQIEKYNIERNHKQHQPNRTTFSLATIKPTLLRLKDNERTSLSWFVEDIWSNQTIIILLATGI